MIRSLWWLRIGKSTISVGYHGWLFHTGAIRTSVTFCCCTLSPLGSRRGLAYPFPSRLVQSWLNASRASASSLVSGQPGCKHIHFRWVPPLLDSVEYIWIQSPIEAILHYTRLLKTPRRLLCSGHLAGVPLSELHLSSCTIAKGPSQCCRFNPGDNVPTSLFTYDTDDELSNLSSTVILFLYLTKYFAT